MRHQCESLLSRLALAAALSCTAPAFSANPPSASGSLAFDDSSVVALADLDSLRGGADVVNQSLVQGAVAGNAAVNVSSGANFISSGSFANSNGFNTVIQNTGSNVLIQSSTIINVQLTQ